MDLTQAANIATIFASSTIFVAILKWFYNQYTLRSPFKIENEKVLLTNVESIPPLISVKITNRHNSSFYIKRILFVGKTRYCVSQIGNELDIGKRNKILLESSRFSPCHLETGAFINHSVTIANDDSYTSLISNIRYLDIVTNRGEYLVPVDNLKEERSVSGLVKFKLESNTRIGFIISKFRYELWKVNSKK